MTPTPTDLAEHFRFGDNWASYARLIDEAKIADAERGLLRLIPREAISGKSFLDIGCGSGIHALAAIRLGAGRVLACDLDPASVATARAVLGRFAAGRRWAAEIVSVFDLDPGRMGKFDIVYSWGVLHHTGDMIRAVQKASGMVAPNGLFAFALYRRTWMDWFWVREKRWYAHASSATQARVQRVYDALYRLAAAILRRERRDLRGMEYWHDVHDWLGGHPYESILADEVDSLMKSLGFAMERRFAQPRQVGLFGSGCDEYVYRRIGGAG